MAPPLKPSPSLNPFSSFSTTFIVEPKIELPIRKYSEIEWMVYLKDHIPY